MTLEEYVIALHKADISNKEQFGSLVSIGMKLMKIDDNELAEYCECAKLTIDRWKTGETVPLKGMRTSVIDWLIKRANEFQNDS